MKLFSAIILGIALSVISYPMPYANSAQNDAQSIFNSKCAMCHGRNGEGNAEMAGMIGGDMSKLSLTDQVTSKKNDKELENIILNGSNKMPAFKSSISAKEANELVKYIRALQKK